MREADTERLLGFSITLTSFPKLGVCRVCVQPGSDSLPPAFWDPRQLGSETQGLWLKLGTAHTRTQTHTQTRRTSLKVGSTDGERDDRAGQMGRIIPLCLSAQFITSLDLSGGKKAILHTFKRTRCNPPLRPR